MKEAILNEEWIGKVQDKSFENKRFENLIVRRGNINNCTFSSCEFFNSYLGFSRFRIRSRYSNCSFKKVKIYGINSSMGDFNHRHSIFENCTFEDVEIRGTTQLTGVEFISCTFSGKIINCILDDFQKARRYPSAVRFKNCDLAKVVFENTSIYGKDVFIDCSLPKNKMVYLDNRDNYLVARAEELVSEIRDKELTISIAVLFDRRIRSKQDIIMIDEALIAGLLKSPEEYQLYQSVISGRIIR